MTYRKLRRTSAHRWSMLRTMVSQLIEHERIETTVHKAKELRRLADKMVTWGKQVRDLACAARPPARLPEPRSPPPPPAPQGTLAARREAAAVVRGDGVQHEHHLWIGQRDEDERDEDHDLQHRARDPLTGAHRWHE